jgi:hypothetical protein
MRPPCIARAEGTAETKDRFRVKSWGAELIGQETTLTVQTTLKGNVKDAKNVKGLHYRLPNGVLLKDGPLLVSFCNAPLDLKVTIKNEAFEASLGRPEYMLFLRVRPAGRFEPVSGQVDPALAVRELHEPEGFLSKLGRK